MNTAALNRFLLACVVLAGVANWLIRLDPTRPNFEFFPDMAHSPAYASFSANPVFADGKTIQEPPPGTVPHGFQPLHYEATEQDELRAGRELGNPYTLEDEPAVERGAEVYRNYCLHCHGAAGWGNGPVVLRGYPAPTSFLAPESIAKPDGQLFHIISYGKKNMPPHASQLSREDRWKVILHIRALQREAEEERRKAEKQQAAEEQPAQPSEAIQ